MFLNFLDYDDGVPIGGICGTNTIFVFQIARFVIRILQVAVPFALIIWGSLDFFKAVIAGDEKEMKQKRKPFISRLVAAIVILLMPTIVNFIIDTIANGREIANENNENSFAYCWKQAGKDIGIINIPVFGTDGTDEFDKTGNY